MPAFFDGQLTFIHIPKCAGTSVLHALSAYQLAINPKTHGHPMRYRHHESLFEIQNWFFNEWDVQRWEKTVLVSIIRNPIYRTISWWKYQKKMITQNLQNFTTWQNSHHKSRKLIFSPLSLANLAVSHFTPEDRNRLDKNSAQIWCKHNTKRYYVNEYIALSFHDFVSRMTVWKKTGCDTPSCPYHVLSPQVDWLRDIDGNIPLNKLNLFLIERLSELNQLLPEMKVIDHMNVTKKNNEDYNEYLTTGSLLLLKNYYTEDFKLYESLKKKPLNQRKPLYFSTR